MYYYLVWPRENRYHSKEALTYSSKKNVVPGSLVKIEIKNNLSIGIVVAKAIAPRFKTKDILEVYSINPLPYSLINLIKWVSEYYPAPISNIIRLFTPNKIYADLNTDKTIHNVPTSSTSLPKLNDEQLNAIEQINNPGTYLLHGRTGSGKTRVYQELVIRNYLENKSSVLLIPEINLTTKSFQDFQKIIPKNSLYVVHSRLTTKERSLIWLNILSSKDPVILIGPRSALFYPIKNLGLIIIDEFHDKSYKSNQMPKFQTIRVASILNKYSRSKLILGSATPNITDYYLAKNKNIPILELKNLATTSSLDEPKYRIVDLKDKDNFLKSNLISNNLIESIQHSLENHKQSLIFLNRRGTARLLMCQNCSWISLCSRCNLPLVYHADRNMLICHTCGFSSQNIPFSCPSCSNVNLVYKTAGIKAVFSELERLFPEAKIIRMDSESINKKNIQEFYQKINSNSYDIIVGTQIITKGLDLKNLNTVGVIQADTSLYLPDYSSKEQTFQLLTQVLGRANRGHTSGNLIIQTYNPESSIISKAIKQDYIGFYEEEILDRNKYNFPPYYNLLKLIIKNKSIKRIEKYSNNLKKDILNKHKPNILIEGPFPSFHAHTKDTHNWQMIVKSKSRSRLVEIVKDLPPKWGYDLDPDDLL